MLEFIPQNWPSNAAFVNSVLIHLQNIEKKIPHHRRFDLPEKRNDCNLLLRASSANKVTTHCLVSEEREANAFPSYLSRALPKKSAI